MLHSIKLLHMGQPKHNYRITLVIILDINFQLFTAVSLQMKVFFWMFAPCGVLGLFQWFGGMYYLYLQGDWFHWAEQCSNSQAENILVMYEDLRSEQSTLHGLYTWMVNIISIIILVCSLLLLVSKTPIFIHDLQPCEY